MTKWETVWLRSSFALLVQKYKYCLLALLVQKFKYGDCVAAHRGVCVCACVCVCVCVCAVGMFGRSMGLRHIY